MDTTILSGSDDTAIQSPEEKIVESLLTQALITVKRGDYETAIVELNKVIDHGTGNLKLLGEIYMWYGKVCQHVKDFKLAMDFFEKELALKQLTGDHVAACDVLKRITKLQMHMGNHSKARRTAESLLEYATDKSELDVEPARVLLTMACLAGAHDARKPEEKSALLAQARESIPTSTTSLSKNQELRAILLEARWHALQKSSEAHDIYKKCIEMGKNVEDFETLHRALFESTILRASNPAVSINDLRTAIFYAETCGAHIDAADYKIVLSKLLLEHGSAHEAYAFCKSALATARKEDPSLIESALFAIFACLNALGRRRQAAYFIVLGSVLNVEKNIESFYKLMDEMMEQQKGESQELAIDASEDVVPNEAAAKFVVKLEHTTNVETWRSVIKELLESATKKKKVVVKKDDEPLDFMELICQMSRQFDDQRCELQPLPYQRPVSAASSTGTNKSHKKFPGLRTAMIRLKDKHIVARLLRSKKSSASMAHDTTISSHTTTSSTASR